LGSEQTISYSHARFVEAELRGSAEDRLRCGRFAAVIACGAATAECAETRTELVNAWCHLLDRCEHRGKVPLVDRRIMGDDE